MDKNCKISIIYSISLKILTIHSLHTKNLTEKQTTRTKKMPKSPMNKSHQYLKAILLHWQTNNAFDENLLQGHPSSYHTDICDKCQNLFLSEGIIDNHHPPSIIFKKSRERNLFSHFPHCRRSLAYARIYDVDIFLSSYPLLRPIAQPKLFKRLLSIRNRSNCYGESRCICLVEYLPFDGHSIALKWLLMVKLL